MKITKGDIWGYLQVQTIADETRTLYKELGEECTLDKRIVVQENKSERLNCLCLNRVLKLLSIGTGKTQCLKFQIQLYLGILMLGYLIHQHMKQLAL